MKLAITLFGTIGAVALLSLPANAAPGHNADALAPVAQAMAVHKVQYREEPPEAYPTGSTDWWRAMDREGRGGFR